MSNKVYEDILYNEDKKNKFLSQYNKQTQTIYRQSFIQSRLEEERLEKDLGEFNLSEIEELMYAFNPLTIAASKARASVIRTYIDWYISNGYMEKAQTNINPMSTIDAETWYEKFVNKEEVLYYSEEQIRAAVDNAVNYQDKAIIQLLFEGAAGKWLSELRNLKEEDIDWDNSILTLYDSDEGIRNEETKRLFFASDKLMSILEKAIAEKEYQKKNGTTEARNPVSDLLENGYVLKPARTRNEYEERIEQHVIYRRLSVLAELYDMPYLRAKNITRSGMLWMAKQILDRDGVLEKPQYIEIADKFNISFVTIGKTTMRSWVPLKQFINIESLNRIYG
ncbi:hypothetical protein P9597_23130 [Aneurinibacillus migulanus]|uniref:phage lytic cycle repressor MrpR family protein n=1 Tax=Aneurinibacillus migulanus TaxID=47500 RepID=UPI002E22E377|nr:hypothetical protein [Aneurinibacillus migulanus]